ncbi:MAG: hypothetical protein ACM32E_17790 [Gemmatimonadota bacterium]
MAAELLRGAEDQVRERQQSLLDAAVAHRRAQQARKLTRAARRAERAEQRLARNWRVALQRRAELKKLADDPWR